MLNVVLFEPEIPFNTGAAIRLCANTGFKLHLIKPLGFDFEDKKLRRAGLDYHEFAEVQLYESFSEYKQRFPDTVIFACTTHGTQRHDHSRFKPGDSLLFGPETRGLPKAVLSSFSSDHKIRLPMVKSSRSLNLANTVAIVCYEAWRQLDFKGAV